MFADMVGFTASAQTNEADALKLLREQEKLVRPVLKTHKGREIKSTGDGFLVEFDSALHAVQCAIDIHRHLHERNGRQGVVPLRLRIGLHLGDVEERDGDIFGDSVNLAARIEPLAEPGGICISEPVFGQVRNKIPNKIEKLEPKVLKNVRFPIDVYRVVLPWTLEESPPASSGPTRLAVLPFTNISPDPKDEYFADGLTEELISVLSQIRGLRVIARTSVGQYKSTPKPIATIGSELGVGSILEGSVRKADGQLRITVQLIDVETEEHRWAQTYDHKLENVFAIQAEVAERTAGALKVELLGSERQAILEGPTSDLAAYESYLRGIQAFQQYHASGENRGDIDRRAETYFEEAIRRDPRFSAAYSYLANHLLGAMGDTRPSREVLPRTRGLVARALELNPNSSDGHTAAGNLALQADQDWARAEAEFQQAIVLNPSNSAARMWYGSLLLVLQRFSEAKKQERVAIELDPLWILPRLELVRAHLFSGDGEGAIALLEKMAGPFSDNLFVRYLLAWAYVFTGRAGDVLELVGPWAGVVEPGPRANRAFVLAALGQPEEARRLSEDWKAGRWPEYLSLADVALACAAAGDKEQALALLERDCREGDKTLWSHYQRPIFDSIRDDPRFAAMLRAMGLPTTLGRPLQRHGSL
jgi:adenylate cyclase